MIEEALRNAVKVKLHMSSSGNGHSLRPHASFILLLSLA